MNLVATQNLDVLFSTPPDSKSYIIKSNRGAIEKSSEPGEGSSLSLALALSLSHFKNIKFYSTLIILIASLPAMIAMYRARARAREREKEREREREKQTDRQRQTEREREREKE